MTVLHYIYDPLCGWCYGASPLIQIAATIFPIELHGGGMMRNTEITPSFKAYVNQADKRISQLTGQTFGDGYNHGLLSQTGTLLDSAPPICAILTAEQLSRRGVEMLAKIQQAHYLDGRKISQSAVLFELAKELGFDSQAFAARFSELQPQANAQHIQHTQNLMTRWQVQGFPTLVLEKNGQLIRLNHSDYYGKPEAWREYLQTLLG